MNGLLRVLLLLGLPGQGTGRGHSRRYQSSSRIHEEVHGDPRRPCARRTIKHHFLLQAEPVLRFTDPVWRLKGRGDVCLAG